MIPKHWPQKSFHEIADSRNRGVEGIVRLNPFSAEFASFDEADESQPYEVVLRSAGCWIVVQDPTDYTLTRVLFVEQRDRTLSDGSYPFEIASGGVDLTQDSNIWETAIREVREETGIILDEVEIRPLAIAIKSEQQKFELPLIPLGVSDAIWVHIDEFQKNEAPMVGGMIFLAVIRFDQVNPLLQYISRRFPDQTITLPPPQGVDPIEIKSLALTPLLHVIESTADEASMTGHQWAHNPGKAAFIAAAIPVE